MRKKKKVFFISVCLSASMFLSACDDIVRYSNSAMREVRVNASELQAPEYNNDRVLATMAVANGANDFAFKASAKLAANVDDENFVFSPYSVWLPLAALVNATDDQNKGNLLTALGTSGITEEDLNNASSRMLFDLTKEMKKEYGEYHNPLKIVNAIFVDKDVTIKKDFAQKFMDFYRGKSISVDFASNDVVDTINSMGI